MPHHDCHTLSYSEDVKGWPSFYSFCADYMVGMNGFFYTWSGGELFRHNTNPLRNTYYGVFTPSTINCFLTWVMDQCWTLGLRKKKGNGLLF